jgi:hypothetical protein
MKQRLPNRRPDRVWGGRGEGSCCSVCGAAVQDEEFEVEIEFARADNGLGPDVHHLHIRCFNAWELEQAVKRQNGELAWNPISFSDQARPATPTTGAIDSSRSSPVTDGSGARLSGANPEGNMPGSERETPHRRGPA